LISGTTSGTCGSMRNALDLSMTTAPAWTSMGAYAFDWTEPAEQKAICTPLKAPGSIFWTRTGSPRNGTVFPTERSAANTRSPLDPVGVLRHAERVPEQHRGRQDRGDRVRDPLAGDVRRGAVHRLVEPHRTAERRRRQHPHRARENRRLIR